MTRLFNDPATFTEDMLAGFLDANAQYVVGVPGGVVRATETPPGKVAVVVGGGSGHYPAFCGVVGHGLRRRRRRRQHLHLAVCAARQPPWRAPRTATPGVLCSPATTPAT